jgi:hypothetical protein
VTRSRSLSVSEMREIRLRRRSMITKAVAWLLGLPFVVVVCAAAITLSPPPSELLSSIVVVLAIFAAVPLCIVLSNDYFKRAGVLRRQCRDSKVLVCEGAVADLALEQRQLKKLGQQIGQRSEVVIEVLKDSGLVWAIDGGSQESWVVVPRARTTGLSDHARLAAQYVKPVETKHGTLRLHQRLLSEAECDELRGYLPRIRRTNAIVAFVVNTIAMAHLVGYAREPVGVPLLGIVLVALAGWLDAQLVHLAQARRRVLRDLRDRLVVIYRPDEAVDASEYSIVEFLPHSGAEWTNGGRAARWRRSYESTV